jgi:glycosyltransferase involved in cell wall biosynthesis
MTIPLDGLEGEVEVSVIVASYNSSRTIGRCLESLQRQNGSHAYEVIVVDSSTDRTAERVAQRFPEVRLFTFAERKYPGDARNAGICRARGRILAFTDADCIVDANWIAEIVKAHENPHAIIGGSVDNANPESYVGWGYYFCEFSHWMPQLPPGTMVEIPTCCLSLKRWAFDQYGPFLEGVYCSDTEFNWKLARAGHQPLFVPSIKVSHINVESLARFLRHEPMHGRAFARLRARVEGFSRNRRLLYILLSPLLPMLLWFRVARLVMAHGEIRSRFLAASPVVLAGFAAWSLGELAGYLSPARRMEMDEAPAAASG